MMYCPKCGMEHPEDIHFCTKCGYDFSLEEQQPTAVDNSRNSYLKKYWYIFIGLILAACLGVGALWLNQRTVDITGTWTLTKVAMPKRLAENTQFDEINQLLDKADGYTLIIDEQGKLTIDIDVEDNLLRLSNILLEKREDAYFIKDLYQMMIQTDIQELSVSLNWAAALGVVKKEEEHYQLSQGSIPAIETLLADYTGLKVNLKGMIEHELELISLKRKDHQLHIVSPYIENLSIALTKESD